MAADPPRIEKRIAIIQSCYIPWKGYFDIINSVDEFVFLDTAQYTKRDWRNRNRIMTGNGACWLTIPVCSKGRYFQQIDETEIAEPWAERHWRILETNYSKAPHFHSMAPAIRSLYESCAKEKYLSRINFTLIAGICRLLGIVTKLCWSSQYPESGRRTDRLLSICEGAGATHYLSGPSAAAYIEPSKFRGAGIGLSYADYKGYPEYPQLGGSFVHEVSILDMLFCLGSDARRFLKSFAHAA